MPSSEITQIQSTNTALPNTAVTLQGKHPEAHQSSASPAGSKNTQPTTVLEWAERLVSDVRQPGKLPPEYLAILEAQLADLCRDVPQRTTMPADPTVPTVIRDTASLVQLAETIRGAPAVAIDLETSSLDPRTGEIVGVGFAMAAGVFYVPINHYVKDNQRLLPDQLPLGSLANAVDFQRAPLVAHNAKFELKWLRHHLGIKPHFVWDTLLAARLLRSDRSASLKELAASELDVPGWGLTTRELQAIQFLPIDRVSRYCGKDCCYTLKLYERQQTCLD